MVTPVEPGLYVRLAKGCELMTRGVPVKADEIEALMRGEGCWRSIYRRYRDCVNRPQKTGCGRSTPKFSRRPAEDGAVGCNLLLAPFLRNFHFSQVW